MRTAHNKTPEETERKAIELYNTFHTPKEISEILKLSRPTFDKICKRNGIKRNLKTKYAALATHKRCKKCKQIKEVSYFPNCKLRKYSGKSNLCTECYKINYREWSNQYRKNNLSTTRQKNRELAKKWRRENPQYKVAQNLRRRMRELIKNKSLTSINLLGCEMSFFINYIESKWTENMSWSNYGVYKIGRQKTWHIDHIKPCASFDLTQIEQQKKCFHYTNLQPLWADENMSKGSN